MFSTCRMKQKPMFMIIPMIDIIFFLLVFFMMSGAGGELKSLPVQLPTARHASDAYVPPVHIVLQKEGSLFIEEKQVSMEEAAQYMQHITKENGNVSALLEADKESSYGQVIEVMDMLKGAGVKRLAVAAQ
ncbi:MAG: ExbD/TolR family protein [Dialister pneumosintes]